MVVQDEWAGRWRELSEEVLSGVQEWRGTHPRATFREIETVVEEQLGRLRARMLEEAALASAARDWTEAPRAERPTCPECGGPLTARGQQSRTVTVAGGRPVRLQRGYGVCSACGTELFPPG